MKRTREQDRVDYKEECEIGVLTGDFAPAQESTFKFRAEDAALRNVWRGAFNSSCHKVLEPSAAHDSVQCVFDGREWSAPAAGTIREEICLLIHWDR